MNKQHLSLIKAHYGNAYPLWVETPSDDGIFPGSDLREDEVEEIPVSVVKGKVVEGRVLGRGSYTGDMTTNTDYIAYVPLHALGKACKCRVCSEA